jgi:hypothetical protein
VIVWIVFGLSGAGIMLTEAWWRGERIVASELVVFVILGVLTGPLLYLLSLDTVFKYVESHLLQLNYFLIRRINPLVPKWMDGIEVLRGRNR